MSKNKLMEELKKLLSQEIFKWIIINNEQTHYLVSSYGKIYTTNLYGRTNKFKELKTEINNRGYAQTTIYHKGKPYPFLIHIIVAKYFIPNPDNLKTVNHINGIKTDNNVSNLEWMSHKDNSIHAANNKLLPTGEKSRLARITNETAKKICIEFELNELTLNEIAKKYNTTYNTVYDIFRKRAWKQVSIKYDFSKYTKDNRYKSKVKNK